MSELAERLMIMSGGRALQFDAAPGGARPEWTPADAAMACQGLDQRRYAAFAYRWARDESLYSTLWGALFNASAELAEHERWPTRTSTNDRYLDSLVRLAIFEELNPPSVVISRMEAQERARLFHQDPGAIEELLRDGLTSRLRPILMASQAGVPLNVWNAELSRRYEGIRGILESWCGQARAHASRWLNDHFEADLADPGSDPSEQKSPLTYKQQRDQRIAQGYRSGKTVAELASRHGVTTRRVYQLIQQLGPCNSGLAV